MNYEITNEQRKLLTEEVLGECWHEVSGIGTLCFICGKCRKEYSISWLPRTFTTDTDMLTVFRAIRDKGLWNQFEPYCWKKSELKGMDGLDNFMPWLFLDSPERACVLAAEFWKENV